MKVFKRLVAISTAVMLFLLCFSLVGCTHVSKEVQLIVGEWEPFNLGQPFEITSKGELIVDGETYEISYKEKYFVESAGVTRYLYETTYPEYAEIIYNGYNTLYVDGEDGLAKHSWSRVKD